MIDTKINYNSSQLTASEGHSDIYAIGVESELKEIPFSKPIRLLRCCLKLAITPQWFTLNQVIIWSIANDYDNLLTSIGSQWPVNILTKNSFFISHNTSNFCTIRDHSKPYFCPLLRTGISTIVLNFHRLILGVVLFSRQ